jgi:vancomycin resistance protein YoaR
MTHHEHKHHESADHETTAEKKERQAMHHGLKWTLIAVAVITTLLLLSGAAIAGTILVSYESKIIPRVVIGSHTFGGKSVTAAEETLTELSDTIEEQGISLEIESDTIIVPGTITAEDAGGTDLVLFDIDPTQTAAQLFGLGHSGPIYQKLADSVLQFLYPRPQTAAVTLDEEQLRAFLDTALKKYETAPVNATIAVKNGNTLEIEPEKNGQTIDRDAVIAELTWRTEHLNNDVITLELKDTPPPLTTASIKAHESEILGLLTHAPLTFTYEDASWEFDATEIGSWLLYTEKGLVINTTTLKQSLDEKNMGIEVEPKEGKWKVESKDNKVTAITPLADAVVGKKIDVEKLATEIVPALEKDNAPKIALELIEEAPKFGGEDGEELPVKELLGTGHSNMTGSPYNRQLNIKRGVELLNGLVIAQGEEFSLLEALKPFTAGNGYHAELVIKGNETIPEIGGGLCQVGTTTFRAAMESGLDITRRQNHSYAVSYYSDDRNGLPGTDATIYDPAPDFKFMNDTPGPIIIQTRIEGTHLYFDFFGTSDGRDGSFSAPTITGWIQPPPTKEVETDTLPEGARKCTETAHPGTTASFKYTVKKADGTTHEEVFTSKYKPWQAVCLVGKKTTPTPTPAPEKTDTKKSTPKKSDKKTNSNTKKE